MKTLVHIVRRDHSFPAEVRGDDDLVIRSSDGEPRWVDDDGKVLDARAVIDRIFEADGVVVW